MTDTPLEGSSYNDYRVLNGFIVIYSVDKIL